MPDLPMDSFAKGFHMTDNLMNQILNRKKVSQEHDEFLAKQKQLEQHFQQNFGLSKAKAGRAAQAAADAHRIAMNQLDPTFAAKQYEALENWYKNKGKSSNGAQATGQNASKQAYPDLHKMFAGQGMFPENQLEEGNRPQSANPVNYGEDSGTPQNDVFNYLMNKGQAEDNESAQMPQELMPTQEAGQGLGMLSQEGLGQMQQAGREKQQQQAKQAQAAQQQQALPGNPSHADLELMRQFPALRGFISTIFILTLWQKKKKTKLLQIYSNKSGIIVLNIHLLQPLE